MSVARQRYSYGPAPEPGPVEPPRPRRSSLRAWIVTKLLAVILLFGASGLLYHVAASDAFVIREVAVAGSQLVPSAEIERASAVTGLNVFWIREEEVGHRLQAIAAIQSARARTVLPDRLEVRIVERAPVAVWQNGGVSYLVDADGRVLTEIDVAVALPTIRDVDPRPIHPGGTVDSAALSTMFQLQQLLPRIAGITPRELEYSQDAGVTMLTEAGQRVRFGSDDDLEWKVSVLVAVRRDMERLGQRPELIDVRFKDRPYVR